MMTMLLLKKKLPVPFPFHLLHFSSVTKTSNPKPPNFMTEYLINSCGFSPEKAATASKPLSNLTSTKNPDSVIHFLKHHGGFSDSQIRSLISSRPRILRADVNETLMPNLHGLRKIGFSDDDDLRNVLTRNPSALLLASAVSRLEYWKTFLGGMEKLVCALTRNLELVSYNVDTTIAAKIAFLKGYGMSEADIGTLIVRGRRFIGMSIASMEALVKTSEELGFRRGSPMFVLSLTALSGCKAGGLKNKMELLRSFGWTEKEVLDTLLTAPFLTCLSEENIRKTMEFLVETAGTDHHYIASHPVILCYSLEKRLIPRYRILKTLQSNKLAENYRGLYNVACLSEKSFVEKFILPYQNIVPKLLETYGDARAGGVQS